VARFNYLFAINALSAAGGCVGRFSEARGRINYVGWFGIVVARACESARGFVMLGGPIIYHARRYNMQKLLCSALRCGG